MLFPAGTHDGVRLHLNDTHYTVLCTYHQNIYLFRISLIIFPLQFVLSSVFVLFVNICLLKTFVGPRKKAR